MNRENVQASINIMQRVIDRGSNFNLSYWASGGALESCKSEESYHKCGMSACWGGWVAVAPEWPGGVDEGGIPVIENCYGEGLGGVEALAYWLDVDYDVVNAIAGIGSDGAETYSQVRNLKDVTPQMVIAKLEGLLDE
ncbi:MAG: hypothetical protein JKY96_02330 [Phycisphaerales bacterium]|nr:hypothetical protein [Phycisphaerales bacterium]